MFNKAEVFCSLCLCCIKLIADLYLALSQALVKCLEINVFKTNIFLSGQSFTTCFFPQCVLNYISTTCCFRYPNLKSWGLLKCLKTLQLTCLCDYLIFSICVCVLQCSKVTWWYCDTVSCVLSKEFYVPICRTAPEHQSVILLCLKCVRCWVFSIVKGLPKVKSIVGKVPVLCFLLFFFESLRKIIYSVLVFSLASLHDFLISFVKLICLLLKSVFQPV